MKQEYHRVKLSNTGAWTNQNLSFARALGDVFIYAEAIVAAAMKRTESRNSPYRPNYPNRNNKNWHTTTIIRYDVAKDRPVFEYDPVPTAG